jgi:hypothetical protein
LQLRFAIQVAGLRMSYVGNGGRRVGCASIAVCVVEHGGAKVSHSTGRPPGVAETVEKKNALPELIGGAVNVHLQTARPKVPVDDT